MSTSIAIAATPARAAELGQLLAGDLRLVDHADGAQPPDCVLVVHEPPEIDALSQLARLGGPDGLPRVAVVVVSSGTVPNLRRAALRAGAMEILEQEQLEPEALSAAVEDAIERFSVARRLSRRPGDPARLAEPAGALEGRLRATFEHAAIGIAHTDPDGRFLDANPALSRLTGYSVDELRSRTFADITHPADLAEDWAHARRVLAGEIPSYCMEKRYIRKDGTTVWVNLCVALARDESTGQPFFIAVTEDIDAKKAAEQALAVAHGRLRAALTATDVGLWQWDPQRDVLLGDRNLTRLFGLEVQDDAVPLAPYVERIHPDDRPRVEAAIARALASGGLYDEVYRVVHPDGSVRSLHARGLVELDADGTPVSFPGIALDVTRHFETTERLRESDERYRALLDSVEDGFCIFDVIFDESGERAIDHRFVELNASFTRQTGIVGAVGKTARELVPEIDERWHEIYGRVARTREVARFERHEPAMHRWFEVQVMPVGAPERRRVAVLFRDVTARRETEETLRRSEAAARRGEQFALRVINNLFAFVGVLDTSGTLLGANEAPLAAAGIGIEDVRGKKFWDCYWWSYSDEVRQQLRAACERAARGEVVRYDAVVRIAGDARGIIDFQVAPLRDETGQITHLIPSAIDVTERRRAELELRRSEARFRRVFETNLLGILFGDLHGGAHDANDAFLRMIGYDRADLEAGAIDWKRITPPEHRAKDERVVDELRRTGTHVPAEKEYIRKDGSRVWVLLGSAVIEGESGVSFIIDISRQKQTETALRESEARFRTISEALPGLVFVHSSEGRNSFVNRFFCEFAGREPEGLLDDRWADLLHPEDAELVWSLWREAAAGGRPFEAVYRLRRRDGAWRWHLVRSVPQRNADGSIAQWIGTATDITERKQVEQALMEADRRKDDFIAILAHELRNPLAPVRTAVEIVKMVAPGEPRLQRARDVIDRQVTHMTRLIDDLLDVSRIARGKLPLQKERCDLAAIARQTSEDYRASLEAEGLSLVVSEAVGPVWVEGDPVRLAQMIGNLLHNAGRFTGRGGRLEVRVESDAVNRLAQVSVADNGVGIDPALLSRLFDPFSQADQDLARSKGGLGLGLALTKGLAELHGGGVAAHSEGPGRGATFTVRIPLSATQYQTASPDSAASRAGGGLRILIVEDNQDAAEMLGALLELGGHEVKLALDGATAIADAPAFQPQVVISDIGLPGQLDGYAVARTLRAEPALAGVYLIALSGYASDEARRRAREAGFDDHLAKPPDIAALTRTLAAIASK